MWEDDTPKAPQREEEMPRPHLRQQERQGEYVLLAQIVLSLLLFGFLYTAKFMDWPIYRQFRTEFSTAMQAPGPAVFAEDRGFLKFTQQACAELWQSVRQVMGELCVEEPATAETARPVHAANRAAPYTNRSRDRFRRPRPCRGERRLQQSRRSPPHGDPDIRGARPKRRRESPDDALGVCSAGQDRRLRSRS